MKIAIKIIPNSYEEEDGFSFCGGKISIGDDFWEEFNIALNYWTTDDYKRQWKEGLERIKTHTTSCLVASVQHPQKTPPLINWWILYKVDNKIIVQNHLLSDMVYRKRIGKNIFSPQSCYNFIPRRRTILPGGLQASEWEVDMG